ncbi:MAG: hypothetical protein AB3K77_03105 [Methanosarcinaceae archaeon]
MKIDNIVKEELWSSTATSFFFFMIFSFIRREGYVLIEYEVILILAFFCTAVCFSLLVWYRRKEQLLSPSIFLIIDHIFESESHEEKTTEPYKDEETNIYSSIRKNMGLLIITMFLYIIYLYASLVYNIDQMYWILILLFMGIALSKIIYGEREGDQKDPMKLLIFYVIVCVFIFTRYLILGYPIRPILEGSIILGIVLVLLVLGIKWSHRKQNSDN